MAFKTCHDLVQTNFASFSPHSVSSFSCSCKWNQFSMPCLTYSLPCLMLFLLNVMFLSLMCNDFWASRQGCIPDDGILIAPVCNAHASSALLEHFIFTSTGIQNLASWRRSSLLKIYCWFSFFCSPQCHIILYSVHAQKMYFEGINE